MAARAPPASPLSCGSSGAGPVSGRAAGAPLSCRNAHHHRPVRDPRKRSLGLPRAAGAGEGPPPLSPGNRGDAGEGILLLLEVHGNLAERRLSRIPGARHQGRKDTRPVPRGTLHRARENTEASRAGPQGPDRRHAHGGARAADREGGCPPGGDRLGRNVEHARLCPAVPEHEAQRAGVGARPRDQPVRGRRPLHRGFMVGGRSRRSREAFCGRCSRGTRCSWRRW